MIRLEKPLSTLKDLENLPDDVRAELIDGDIIMMAASTMHSLTCSALTSEIRSHVKGRTDRLDKDGWIIIAEAWVYYDDHNSFVHDLAGFFRKDLSSSSDRGPLRAKPTWVCEVMSPSNWSNDTQRKRIILEQHQIPYYWIVDPYRKTIQVFELKDKNEHYQIIYAADIGDGIVKLPPFESLELDLNELFEDLGNKT
ncbi:MAG: Uma2 family endonuclease [Myxococcaceae bacterium]